MQGLCRIWLVFALAVACGVGSNTRAWADEHGTRVAVIEMARILGEASAVHSIRTQGEAQRRSYAADAQRESERLRGVRDELQQQATLLSPTVLEERQRAFNAEVAAADQRAKTRNQALQSAVAHGESRFREVLAVVVEEVATEQGVELVLPVHVSIYAVAESNLTDLVIERLNEAYPEIVLTFDEN
ncbi:MAG: OmpH family outer membrane protein [Rhodospirillales bacterium]|nr:OmpH family outer membrane protein [Rhodospirillales bacterium]